MSQTLPYDAQLDIGTLSRVLDRNRVSNSYKYFWLQAILTLISENKITFTYNELLDEMIASAWYMVTEYHLRLGPNNTTDNLEEVVKYLHEKDESLATTAPKDKIKEKLGELSEDRQIKKFKDDLIVNVPYCMQSPFYASLKNPSKSQIERINEYAHLVYGIGTFAKTETEITIRDEWVDYLVHNREILQAWVNYKLIHYLQDRNPSVPGIADKIEKPEMRNLARVQKYWNLIIEIDPTITEIYHDTRMADEKLSIDHFVPWQYVAHDELWNLSPTTKNINSIKSNHLPNWNAYYKKLAGLEYRAYSICNQYEAARKQFEICAGYHVNNAEIRANLYRAGQTRQQFEEQLYHVLRPVYDAAEMCGFHEKKLEIY